MLIRVSFSLGHTFCPFPPNMGPSSTPGILPYEWQRGGVINRSVSPVPTPQGSWFPKQFPVHNFFSTTNLCEHIQLANNVLQSMLNCGEISLLSRGVVRGGCVAGMPPKPSVSPFLLATSSNLLCL